MKVKDRVRFNIFRNRARQKKAKQKIIKITGITFICLLISLVLITMSFSYFKEEKSIANKKNILEKEKKQTQTQPEINKIEETKPNIKDPIINPDTNIEKNERFKITVLGDIMMGGNNFNTDKKSYMLAFKYIAENTTKSDYTIANLATNISNLEKIENAKSKYIVKRDILNAFNVLGINGVNIANDHMLDFGYEQFNITTTILKAANINIIGLSKDIVYAEKNGLRIAFVAINNIAIGNSFEYTNAGINMYNPIKSKELLDQANKYADCVIAMPHYGKENTYMVSDNMKEISKWLIDSGADIVIGSHALGIYPIEEYNGKVIIYSTGYFMSDTNYEIGKQSAIFNIYINTKAQVTEVELLPIYIDSNKDVKLYYDINEKDSNNYLDKLFIKRTFNKYKIEKQRDKITVTLKPD